MDSEFWEHFKAERMETPLDVFAKEDKEYQKCRLKYYEERENLEKALRDKNPDEVALLEKLDEAMCGYAARYADAAYSLGFHDGMDIGMEHREVSEKKDSRQGNTITLEDMIDLIYILDAYRELNKALYGYDMAHTYDMGILGALGRVYKIINNHASPKLQEADAYEEEKILADTSKTPEERAKILVGRTIKRI